MAAAYIKNNQKDKAYTVLQEALKHDYENWKIWENYLWVIMLNLVVPIESLPPLNKWLFLIQNIYLYNKINYLNRHLKFV